MLILLPVLDAKQKALLDQVLAHWQKVEDLTEEERFYLTLETLLRFLRATKWNATEAIKRLQATIACALNCLLDLTLLTGSQGEKNGKWTPGRPSISLRSRKRANSYCGYTPPSRSLADSAQDMATI